MFPPSDFDLEHIRAFESVLVELFKMGVTVLKPRPQKATTNNMKTSMSKDRHATSKAPLVSVSKFKTPSIEGGADIFAGDFPKGLLVEEEASATVQWYPSNDVNSKRLRNVYNGSNLAEAARLGDIKQVKTLLDHSADPNGSRSSGQATPLQCAAYHGHLDVMSLLLNRGASVSLTHGSIGTALHAASLHGTPAACLLLLSRGANIEKMIPHGRLSGLTPLQTAAFGHNEATLRFLLDRGASCTDLSPQLASCGMFCDWEDLSPDFQDAVVSDIMADASRIYTNIVEAAKWDARDAVTSFLSTSKQSTADLLTSKDATLSRTPLHWAATSSSSPATLHAILTHPSVPIAHLLRMKDRPGHTPMVLACTYSQDIDLIRELRRAAADAAKNVSSSTTEKDLAGTIAAAAGGGVGKAGVEETELWGKVVLAEKFLGMSF